MNVNIVKSETAQHQMNVKGLSILCAHLFNCYCHLTLVVTFIWCYAVSEFTMFTFIGGVLTASMAFQYFVLIGSIVTAIYALVRDLHEWYDRILEEIINILKACR